MSSRDSTSKQYRYLDPTEVTKTAQLLAERIRQRFPSSDLLQVSQELVCIAVETQARSTDMNRPFWFIRALNALLIVFAVTIFIYGGHSLNVRYDAVSIADLLQAIEAATSELVVIGAGLIFLFGVENRVKRSRGLAALHELRAMAHIIDMHQLTKDPARISQGTMIWTPASPRVDLDAFQLARYLDYCSEMLSLLGKIAALYAQHFAEPVLLSAVDEIESLTTSLSRKIWQKIVMINDTALKS